MWESGGRKIGSCWLLEREVSGKKRAGPGPAAAVPTADASGWRASRCTRPPVFAYLKSWDASWPDSGRGIAELRSARKYGGLNQRYFDSTSPPIEPRCTAADCAEVGLGSLGRRLREHCSGKPLLRPSSALVGKPVPVVMVNSMCLGNYDPRAGGRLMEWWINFGTFSLTTL